ncbi:MAG: GIY-YIG nuclease family protein [Minisyncoccales bacterium]
MKLNKNDQSFKFFSKESIEKIPPACGVYCFKGKDKIFYIGKSKNLKERIKNHFLFPSFKNSYFLKETKKIGIILTENEWFALLLESRLIKKYKPRFNVLWRDDKNYFFLAVSKEEFPRIFITHQKKEKNLLYLGPFFEGKILKKTLFFLRKIFPFYSQKKHPRKKCSWCYLGYCPGPFPDKREYQKNVRSILAVFKGKASLLLKKMEKEMLFWAKKENFELAQKIKDQIFYLKKIISNASLIKEEMGGEREWEKLRKELQKFFAVKLNFERVEAFDVSNIQGKEAVGSLVVFLKGKPFPPGYRRFKIRSKEEPNDILMTKEILKRRFLHAEWPFPQLVLLDGGKAHLRAGLSLKKENLALKNTFFIALAKASQRIFSEKKKKPIFLKDLKRPILRLIGEINKESHRFAISYHRKLRERLLLEKK